MSGEARNSFHEEQSYEEIVSIAMLAENLVYRLPGCDDLMVRKTLQDVYRDFCRRSCCLHTIRRQILAAGQAVIPVPAIFGGVVYSITHVAINGRKLEEGLDYHVDNGTVRSIVLAPRNIVPPATDPSAFPSVEFCWVEMPKINSEDAPQWFIDMWGDAVIAGTLARLTSMTGRLWYDPNKSVEYRTEYEGYLTDARMRYYGSDAGFAKTLPNDELI